MIKMLWDLKDIDKYLFTCILFVMLYSTSEGNHLTVKSIIIENYDLMEDILYICFKVESISVISGIIHLHK